MYKRVLTDLTRNALRAKIGLIVNQHGARNTAADLHKATRHFSARNRSDLSFGQYGKLQVVPQNNFRLETVFVIFVNVYGTICKYT